MSFLFAPCLIDFYHSVSLVSYSVTKGFFFLDRQCLIKGGNNTRRFILLQVTLNQIIIYKCNQYKTTFIFAFLISTWNVYKFLSNQFSYLDNRQRVRFICQKNHEKTLIITVQNGDISTYTFLFEEKTIQVFSYDFN